MAVIDVGGKDRVSDVDLAYESDSLLGEGARWCAETQSLYWVDILECKLHRLDALSGINATWALPKKVGCSVAIDDRRRLLALEDGIYEIDLISSHVRLLQKVEHATSTHRFNDGFLDPTGRFWVGSMNESGAHDGCLYCFQTVFSPPVLHGSDWGCPNGIGWSPRGDVMYVTDSRERKIWSFDYCADTGAISRKRVFASFVSGVPDGLTVDHDGNVWSALWDAWSVVQIAPDGNLLRKVSVPVKRPTSLAFGGRDGKTLYITTASVNVPLNDRRIPAIDGSIFHIQADTGGPAESRIHVVESQ